jgi:hypothetical protein
MTHGITCNCEVCRAERGEDDEDEIDITDYGRTDATDNV